MNNQYRGADAWDRYLDALEARSPAIQAIGVPAHSEMGRERRMAQPWRLHKIAPENPWGALLKVLRTRC